MPGTTQFVGVAEHHAFALGVDTLASHVVQAQHDILGRHDDRLAVGGRQHVVGGHHQGARFHLRFQRQRHVDGHLVAVEVGVEGGTDQRVQLDGLALDQDRLEGLDAETVQGRCAVQHDRMFADHFFQDIPDHRLLSLDHALGGLDGGGQAHDFQAVEDERLEQFQRHQLGQAALMQLEGRADHDDRTAGVVDALAEQVLTEAAALALDHVGQGLQGTLVGAGHGLAAATVVEQGVDRLLQHPLLVADDDFRRLQFEQTLQTIVAVDHATVQIVQIGGREAAAVQRDQGTQLGRQHGQHFQDHPLGMDTGFLEGLQHLEALGDLLDLGIGTGLFQFAAQLLDLKAQVDALEQVADTLGTHAGLEFVAVLFQLGEVIVLGHDLAAVERGHAGLGHHIGFEIKYAFDVAQGHVQHHAETAGQGLEEPDVGDRRGQFDMAHAFAANLGQGHLDAAFFADHAAVLEALVLAAQTLVILDRTEYLGAEQTIALRLEGPVVDRLRLLDFAVGPGTNLLG